DPQEILEGILRWVRIESPSDDGEAVNRMVDCIEGDMRSVGDSMRTQLRMPSRISCGSMEGSLVRSAMVYFLVGSRRFSGGRCAALACAWIRASL
ncbi:MAG: hypothetical protein AAF493_28935, partial [Pseudomonadota bacterium]